MNTTAPPPACGQPGDAWSFGAQALQRLRHAIDPRWRGERPRSYWYDAQGQRTANSGVITSLDRKDALIRKT